jgi:hypothetical protein
VQPPPSQVPLWHPKEPQVANSNPVNEKPADKAPAVTEKATKVEKSVNPMDKFKTELPNGLTLHNFVAE